MIHILLCDDEQDIINALKIYLSNEEYTFFEATNGCDAVKIVQQQEIHLILMDIMMPGMDGLTAMAKIRAYSNVPVILLTAKSEDSDKILGLNIGADDYITKPFQPAEVVARVRSQLRRYLHLGGGAVSPSAIVIGGLSLNDSEKQVTVDGEPVSLRPKEFEILKLLMQHPGKIYSPRELYRQVWKEAPMGNENTVAVHIRHLREKIEINPSEPRYLKVIWGQGYKIEKGDL